MVHQPPHLPSTSIRAPVSPASTGFGSQLPSVLCCSEKKQPGQRLAVSLQVSPALRLHPRTLPHRVWRGNVTASDVVRTSCPETHLIVNYALKTNDTLMYWLKTSSVTSELNVSGSSSGGEVHPLRSSTMFAQCNVPPVETQCSTRRPRWDRLA